MFEILKESDLKCYRRIKCNLLSERHQKMHKNKSLALINRFEPVCLDKSMVFGQSKVFIATTFEHTN